MGRGGCQVVEFGKNEQGCLWTMNLGSYFRTGVAMEIWDWGCLFRGGGYPIGFWGVGVSDTGGGTVNHLETAHHRDTTQARFRHTSTVSGLG